MRAGVGYCCSYQCLLPVGWPGNLCVSGTCYAFEYLFRDPSSSVRRALLWTLVSRDSSPTTGAPVRMDLLVHSSLNAKSSNQISSSNGNRQPYRLKIDTGAGTVKRIAILSIGILRVNNRCRNLPLSCRNLPLKAWQPSVAKLEGCLRSSAIERRLGATKTANSERKTRELRPTGACQDVRDPPLRCAKGSVRKRHGRPRQ